MMENQPILRLKPTDEDEHMDIEVDMVTVDTHDRIEPPQSFEEAMQSPYAQKWMEACLGIGCTAEQSDLAAD